MVSGMQTGNEDRMSKKRRCMAAVLLLVLLMLTACGSAEPEEISTIEVQKDGSIIQSTVGSFDKDYYSKEDLESFAKEEIQSYSASGDGTIELSDISMLDDGNVKLTLKFDNSETYTAFEGKTLFMGTIAQAIVAGYEPSGYMTPVEEGESADASVKVKEADYTMDMNILVVQEQYEVTVPGEILWVSSVGTKLTGESSVQINTDELTYIIYQ